MAGNANGPGQLANCDGVGLLSTFNVPDGTFDAPTGTITSSEFVIDAKYINFKIGGGNHNGVDTPDPLTQMQLIVDGQVVRTIRAVGARRSASSAGTSRSSSASPPASASSTRTPAGAATSWSTRSR